MQRSYTYALPATSSGTNLSDLLQFSGVANAPICGLSQGSYMIVAMTDVEPPNLFDSWKVIAFSARARLLFSNAGGYGFGKLGSVICGLTSQSPAGDPNSGGAPGMNEPPDPSLTTTLWSEDDSIPPNLSFAPARYLAVDCNIQLPQPLELPTGVALPNFGIWMRPSLLGSPVSGAVGLTIQAANFKVVYDDGAV